MNLNSYTSEIYFDFTLKRDSTFWLILRSNNSFDKYTCILRITKVDKSQKVFASMGTFITGDNSESIFKVFLKQQLLNISADPNKIYKDNNFSRIKGILIDQGQEKILTKLFCTLYLK